MVAERDVDLDILRPDTVTRRPSVAEDKAAVQPLMRRPPEDDVIQRGRQVAEMRSQDVAAGRRPVGAGEAAQSVLTPANVASAACRSTSAGARPARLPCKGLTDRRGLPPFTLARPPLARTRPSQLASGGPPGPGQPGSKSVANRLRARVFGERDHRSANAAKVLLHRLGTLAGRARRKHVDYGNEDEP